MAKPEWGSKHLCPSCGVKFYDMRRARPTCPSCGAAAEVKAASKATRYRSVEPVPPRADAAPISAPSGESDEKDRIAKQVPDDATETDKTEKKDIVEDASELGEDEVAEVVDGIKSKKDEA